MMRIPPVITCSTDDIDEWIKTSRSYLMHDGKIPIAMMDVIRELILSDPRLGTYFFREIRRFPRLKKEILNNTSFDDHEPAIDEPPGLLGHPGAPKRNRPAHTPDLMFH